MFIVQKVLKHTCNFKLLNLSKEIIVILNQIKSKKKKRNVLYYLHVWIILFFDQSHVWARHVIWIYIFFLFQECFIQTMVEFGNVTYETGCINKQVSYHLSFFPLSSILFINNVHFVVSISSRFWVTLFDYSADFAFNI